MRVDRAERDYIRRHLIVAWSILFWERLWRALWPVATVAGLFLALALMDLLPALPAWAHAGLLGTFVVGAGLALHWGFKEFRLPRGEDAERRVEATSGLRHRPFRAVQDRLASGEDAAQARLWALHQARMQAMLARLRLGWPQPGIARRDPWAVRLGVLLLLVMGVAVGGSDPLGRLGRALMPGAGAIPLQVEAAQVEAWISPPGYTGMAPLRLPPAGSPEAIRVPAGSTVLARLFGGEGEVALVSEKGALPFQAVDKLNHQIETRLDEPGPRRLEVTQGERPVVGWTLDVLPDRPPLAALAEAPETGRNGVLHMSYTAVDDYGVVSLKAELRLAEARTAAEPLEVPLPLPGLKPREVAESTYQDLTAHPWAGLPVDLAVVATDELGQAGRSEPVRLVLPERPFTHPVARAVIEQRRTLSQQPERRRVVALALSAIAEVPESYGDDKVAYLGMQTAAARLRHDRSGASIPSVQELLWDVALRIEDGQLSLAERELRQAQRALMDALSRDASDEEIDRLTQELQEALDRYMQAMAERAQEMARRGELKPAPRNARRVDPQQLKEMVDRARELSKLGSKEAAQEMLRRLQEMLENMQAGTMMASPEGMEGGDEGMGELGEMMRQQQQLLDRTYRQGSPGQRRQGQPQRGQRGQQGQQGQQGEQGEDGQGMEGMAGEQDDLRRRLGELMGRMADAMGGQIPQGLGDAEQAMRDARDALGQGQGDQAVDAQMRALEQMARGMRDMAQQMARQGGQGQEAGDQIGNRREDPLGRPLPAGGLDTNSVDIPDKADTQRAREILDELRRRAAERQRPEVEREYIDRLLERF